MKTQDRATDPDDPGAETATVEEVRGALARLTPDEYRKLMRRARYWAGQGAGLTGGDLLDESVKRLLEGCRKWYGRRSIVDAVTSGIQSIAQDSRRSWRDGPVRSESELSSDDRREGMITNERDQTPDAERQLIAKQELDIVKARFNDDKKTWEVVEASALGLTSEEICELLDLKIDQYNTTVKRIYRVKMQILSGGDR